MLPSRSALVIGLMIAAPAQALDDARRAELRDLLVQDCGSCHGMTLRGGLGPDITPEQLANKPDSYLFGTIRDGHPGTPMPAWRGILGDDEIHHLVKLLKTGGEGS